MVRLNQFVRSVVLALAVCGGAAFANSASAYDANDLAAAAAAVGSAGVALGAAESAYEGYDVVQEGYHAYDVYMTANAGCETSGYGEAGRVQCHLDAEENYYYTLQDINNNSLDLLMAFYDAQSAYYDALSWYEFVFEHQD